MVHRHPIPLDIRLPSILCLFLILHLPDWIPTLSRHYISTSSLTQNMHLECQSKGCVLFQRITVILSQFVYLAALVYCLKGKATFKKLVILFLQYGFVLLDDVHFQYNSMMQGILIFSIEFILRVRNCLFRGEYCQGL